MSTSDREAVIGMSTHDTKPGAVRVGGDSQDEPDTAEVESTRLLANEARDLLRAEGIPDVGIDRLAHRFIAESRGEERDAFIAWAIEQSKGASPAPARPDSGVDKVGEDSFPASDPPSTWASAGERDTAAGRGGARDA